MKTATQVAIEAVIEQFNDDTELHGRGAFLGGKGLVFIELWRNRNCAESRYEIPIQKFLNLAKAQQLPRWYSVQNFGWFVSDQNCRQFRIY